MHSNIYHPDYVVVVDESLLESIDVTEGLNPEGAILINTSKSKDEIEKHLNGYNGKVFTIDARKVSVACLGKYFPNTPMLAGIVKITGVMEWDKFLTEMEASFKHKFSSKPEVIGGNMNALKMAYDEVK